MSILVLKGLSDENQARILGFVIAEGIPCSTSASAAELREYADQIEAETAWESSDESWTDSGCSDYDSDWTSSDTSCE
jgi:hypothetical protein